MFLVVRKIMPALKRENCEFIQISSVRDHIPMICSLGEEPVKIKKEASGDKFQTRF